MHNELKIYTLEEAKDMILGKIGTAFRDKYEIRLAKYTHKYKYINTNKYLIIRKIKGFVYELRLIFGAKTDFYCQSDVELRSKCKEQCDHCKEYYKPLKNR